MTRGTETGEPTDVDARTLHDAFAAPLYRYAWSLLGGDGERATEAVHDALVAGVALDGERATHTERAPWLYALTRTACQQRGLAATCPYTNLATVPAEEPVARMFAHLPSGHRELVELDLRHGLSPAAVARILGLSPGMCVELTRSATRRAADNLHGLRGAPDPSGEDQNGEQAPATLRRHRARRVAAALDLLRPPGPPPGLRGEVLATATAPGLTVVRDRIVAAMRPLDEDGYPAHRVRAPAAHQEGADAAPDPPESGRGAGAAAPLPRPLPEDRLTTADHPVRTEHTASLAAPGESPAPVEPERPRRVLPVVSGLVTVAAAVALWLWASALGGPVTVVGPEAAAPTGPPSSGSSTHASDDAPGPVLREEPEAGSSADPDSGEAAPSEDTRDGSRGGDDAEQRSPRPPQDGDGGEEAPGRPPATDAPEPPQEEAPTIPEPEPEEPGTPEKPEEEAPEEDQGRNGVIGGLLDLFLGTE